MDNQARTRVGYRDLIKRLMTGLKPCLNAGAIIPKSGNNWGYIHYWPMGGLN